MLILYTHQYNPQMKMEGDFWTVFDLVNIVILYVLFFYRIVWLMNVAKVSWESINDNQYIDLVPIGLQISKENSVRLHLA